MHEYVTFDIPAGLKVCLTSMPDLGPNCLLMLSVVGKGSDTVGQPMVLEQQLIKRNPSGLCVVSNAMVRENTHDIRNIVKLLTFLFSG